MQTKKEIEQELHKARTDRDEIICKYNDLKAEHEKLVKQHMEVVNNHTEYLRNLVSHLTSKSIELVDEKGRTQKLWQRPGETPQIRYNPQNDSNSYSMPRSI